MFFHSRRLTLLKAVFLLTVICTLLGVSLIHAQEATETVCAPGFRLFSHELLTTDSVCIPEHPQRIVAVDAYALESMLVLGEKPVASATAGTFQVNFPELSSMVDGVADIGRPVNLEAVVDAHPDLILALDAWIGDQYDKYSAIAPTVSIKFDGVDAEGFLSIVAAAINSPTGFDDAKTVFDNRVSALQKSIAEHKREGTVSVALFYEDALYVYPIDTSFSILPSLGLTSLAAQNEAIGSEWRLEVSKEQLQLLDTDYIFLVTFAGNADEEVANHEMVARLEADPLWQSLKAFKSKQVFVVSSQWITGTLFSEHRVLDDLFNDIAQVDPADVSPNPFMANALPVTPEATPAS